MSRMPCSITDGPASEMDADEEAQEPQEPEYDKERDSPENILVDFISGIDKLFSLNRKQAK